MQHIGDHHELCPLSKMAFFVGSLIRSKLTGAVSNPAPGDSCFGKAGKPFFGVVGSCPGKRLVHIGIRQRQNHALHNRLSSLL